MRADNAQEGNGKYDVFLAHNDKDKPLIEAIGKELKRRGLKPWLDKEQIPPGRWFQDVIQQAIPNVKSVAIFIGSKGLGEWQSIEVRTFISQCVNRKIPVIPVLLPGITKLPSELLILREINWVRFRESVDEIEVLDNLVWGITGERPTKSPIINRIKRKLENEFLSFRPGTQEAKELEEEIQELEKLLSKQQIETERLLRNKNRLKVFALGLPVFLIGLFLLLELSLGHGVWYKLNQLIKQRTETLKIIVSLTYFSIIAASSVLVWLWNLEILPNFRRYYYRERKPFFLTLFCTLVVQILLIFAIILVFLHSKLPTSQEAEILFPQAAKLGPTLIRTYVTNGEVHYAFHEETPLFGPDGYAEITFKNYGRTVEQNSGWVIFLPRGSDISKYRQLRFLIRGEYGGEKVGIKAKDARGTEVALMLEEYHYLSEGKISTDWQEATIPLEDFANVDFGLMDNFSIYSNGQMAGTRPQTIYVGKFQLR